MTGAELRPFQSQLCEACPLFKATRGADVGKPTGQYAHSNQIAATFPAERQDSKQANHAVSIVWLVPSTENFR